MMEHVRTLTREFDTGDSAVLHVESRSGVVSVEGAGLTSVHIEATVRLWSDDPADADDAAAAVAQRIEHEANRVVVRAPSLPESAGGWASIFGVRRSRVDYRIRVPVRTAVRVLSKSGRVEIASVHGRVHVEAASGKCAVADVRGAVTVAARSGSIDIQDVEGAVEVEARSGRLRVRRVSGRVAADARSGAIAVAHVSGDVRVESRSGAVHAEQLTGPLRVRSRCGAVRYRGAVRADVDIEVQTGAIYLEVDPDHPFFVDAESHAGGVRSDLPPRRGGGPPPDGPRVRLRTRAGGIRLGRL